MIQHKITKMHSIIGVFFNKTYNLMRRDLIARIPISKTQNIRKALEIN